MSDVFIVHDTFENAVEAVGKESTLENEWNFNTDIVRSDITLYASWREGNIEEPTESLVYKQVGETYTVTDMDEETLRN